MRALVQPAADCARSADPVGEGSVYCSRAHERPARGRTTRDWNIRLMAQALTTTRVLGLPRGASEQDMKSAFRRLAKDCHPDRNGGDKGAETEVQGAERGLRGPARPAEARGLRPVRPRRFRRATGAAGTASDPTSPPRCPTSSTTCSASSWAAGAAAASARAASAAPTCATTWRSRCRRPSPARPRRSACRPASPARPAPAPAPRPARSLPPARPAAAPARCARRQGFFTIERTCPACQGRGEIINDPCGSCTGSGRVVRERTLSVNIPAGVEDGTRIRLAGEGEAGLRGGPAGDLYIFLSIKPHEFFQRDGADIFCRVPISMTTAALGGQIDVPTIDGEQDAREGARGHARAASSSASRARACRCCAPR